MATPKRRRVMAEINVVPYIDVMLVLLVIFMITAPLLQLGVEIDLPEANAKVLDSNAEPILITIDDKGDYFLNVDGVNELIDADTMQKKVAAFVRRNPEVPVLIGADESIGYGVVYEAMVTLQQAGVPKVGLMSDPTDGG